MYPNLLMIVQLIGQDGGLTVRRDIVWPVESQAMELEAARLSDFEIDTLRSGLHLQKFEPYRGLVIGRKVRINRGALQGLEGTLIRNAKSLRVVLTVDLIQQSVAVELDADAIELV